MRALVIASLCAAASSATAAPSRGGPVIFDEASAMISVGASPNDPAAGYMIRAHVEMSGVKSAQDTARLEWRAGGKVVATAPCKLDITKAYAAGNCEYRDKPIKPVGAVEANLIYHDDSDDKEYIVRTFKLDVVHYTGQWHTWALLQDDLLGAAWIYMDPGAHQYSSGTYRRPRLYAWFSNHDFLGKATLRCTVNGTKKLEDITLGEEGGDDTGELELDHQPKSGPRLTYRWKHVKLNMDVYWGKRDTLEHDMPKTTPPDHVMSDNPGAWDCALRNEGKTIRQLAFTVNADGMIQQDEIQSGKNPIPTVSERVVLVDWRFTKDSSTFDKRIDPAAMKKSMPYGLPWPDHPKVKTIHATFPAKVGADPK